MKETLTRLYPIYRRHLRVTAYVVLITGVALATYIAGSYYLKTEVVLAPQENKEEEVKKEVTYTLTASKPTRLRIPELSIDASFETLGLAPDGTVEVPEAYTTVGWYDGSPTPGARGPSVILGHVDSLLGAGVFYSLGQLDEGDQFTVEREDGTVASFEVTKLERYQQSEFPTDLVYGPINYAGIRLITCSGKYDKGTMRYSHNLVVYGKLVTPATAED